MNRIQIKMLDVRAEPPDHATVGSAGMDLKALDNTVLAPGETDAFPLGFALHIGDHQTCGLILPRSGLAIGGVLPTNVVGLLDSDYQGEVIVHLKNNSGQTFHVERGDRIAQLIFIPVTPVLWELVTEFGFITERGTGGFGSTGDK